ncbi:MAG: PSD1 and planctomycete cytochrome C domain-containing protein [Phycisphaerales bacterium]|nr:PSD1 and planctomycete cytochrome C domain-containing protein [Phycisphaerales bacterium]
MATPSHAASDIDFNRDVLPILANNCFKCHGPDPNTRQAQLRLDSHEGMLAPRTSGPAIVPGEPKASMLLTRITASGDDRMPPVESNLQLTDHEIEVLTEWIKQGAPWETHWAFQAPTPVELPNVQDVDWPHTGIDHFILARLEDAGLRPSPLADRRTLIRRVSLDLNGLPPTQEEVEAFLNDDEDGAYERVVDRLLASPRYGEHMARPWLDLARYADSQGFEKDNPRVMWRYRDWVINALNENVPFDTFTQEQLAGDLMESPDLQQLIATGFHRNTQTNTEGGTDNEEFRSAAVIDRVNTTMQGWMGLTMGCAQCHAHKYDPIEHDEYYGLYAFFNQTEDADLDDDAPFIKAPTRLQHAELEQRNAAFNALDQRLDSPDQELQQAIEQWIAEQPNSTTWTTLEAGSLKAESGATLTMDDNGVIHATGDVPLTDTYVLELGTDLDGITALRLEAIEGADGQGPGRTSHGNFVINEIEVQSVQEESVPILFAGSEATHEQVEYLVTEAIDGDVSATSGWAIAPIYDQDQAAVFRFQEPLSTNGKQVRITLRQTHGTQHVLEHFRLSVTDQSSPGLPLPRSIAEIISTASDQRDEQQQSTLARHVLDRSPSLASLRDEHAHAKQQRDAFMEAIPNALVLRELAEDKQRTTHLFLGGSFLAPDTERGRIDPGVPAVLHPFPDTLPRNRLGLAQWLVHPDNPMTARVQVNRLWAELFGRGLVSTVDDFGVQGARPSHPALLDWLAMHWMHELHWSPKALVRLLVTSAVYQQDASVLDESMIRNDPDNRLLSRSPRLRLSAEQLRDQALFNAGLLVDEPIGGPSVLPHLPDGMLPQAFTSLVLQPSTGDDLYRRGLYTTWRRTGHYPSFATFDAPSREFCIITRQRSNTPLQALVLLNDTVFVEAAQAMARLLIERDQHDIDGRINTLFRIALSRAPTGEERTILHELYEATLSEAAKHPDQARILATTPRGDLPEMMAAEDAAAMTAVCNVVFNLDEYVNRP